MITPLPAPQLTSIGGDIGPFCISGQSIIPWEAMVEQGGAEWYACQGAMEDPDNGYSSLANINAGRELLEIIITFYWLKPAWPTKYMVDRYSEAIHREHPNHPTVPGAVWIDLEEHNDGVSEYPQSQIEDRAQGVYEGLRANFRDMRITFYTRPDFIEHYAPGLKPLIASLDHIAWAAWPDYGLDSYYQALADTRAGTMRECTDLGAPAPRPYRMINVYDGQHGPDLTLSPMATQWTWQRSSRIRPLEYRGTGIRFDHGYDTDHCNLTHAQHLRWLRFQPLEPPVDPGPEVITLEGLDARLKTAEGQIADLQGRLAKIEALPWYKTMVPVVNK